MNKETHETLNNLRESVVSHHEEATISKSSNRDRPKRFHFYRGIEDITETIISEIDELLEE